MTPNDPEAAINSLEKDERLAMLLAELMDQAHDGSDVDIQKVALEHPDLGEELKQLWAMVKVTDVAAEAPIAKADSDPFEDDTLNLPCKFGDYEIVEEIGRGGMGVVYRARQISLSREVALKMILRGTLASDQDRRRFYSEAEAAAQLDHQGIVPVYEVGRLKGHSFFSMQLIDGQGLDREINGLPMEPRKAAELLEQVARSMHYAHEKGVLHRDLKPSNIMIDRDGQPHITDFGLAKRVTDTVQETKSKVVGTPMYMAPEQAAGVRGQVGPGTDIYSIGTILYLMLTGRPPFVGSTPIDTIRMVIEQDPTVPRVLNRGCDRTLEQIALKCLQKPAELRYQTAEDLANDLRAYLNDETVSVWSGKFGQVVSRLFRETHHASVLENWGVLWMWHSLVLLIVCFLTNIMTLSGVIDPIKYSLVWIVGFGAWAIVFWKIRQKIGPVTFVERQIAHIWAASMISIALMFPLEYLMDVGVLFLSPLLGIIAGSVFLIKAGILSGSFYAQSVALYATSLLMALFPESGHFIFGIVSAGCFFFPGLKYYRQGKQNERRR